MLLNQRSVILWCAKDWRNGAAVSRKGECNDDVGRICVLIGGVVGYWRGAGMVAMAGASLTGFSISTSGYLQYHGRCSLSETTA